MRERVESSGIYVIVSYVTARITASPTPSKFYYRYTDIKGEIKILWYCEVLQRGRAKKYTDGRLKHRV